jgi:hypothetical protein
VPRLFGIMVDRWLIGSVPVERSSRLARLRQDAASSPLQKLAARAYREMIGFWV